MKAVLLYDGYCNFCIAIIRILEFVDSKIYSEQSRVSRVPIQSASFFKHKYKLTSKELAAEIHLITPKGKVLKGEKALIKLGDYLPKLKLLFLIFSTPLGKSIYNLISRNRRKILGCSKNCYISSQT